jgi:hypothetical protein
MSTTRTTVTKRTRTRTGSEVVEEATYDESRGKERKLPQSDGAAATTTTMTPTAPPKKKLTHNVLLHTFELRGSEGEYQRLHFLLLFFVPMSYFCLLRKRAYYNSFIPISLPSFISRKLECMPSAHLLFYTRSNEKTVDH